MYLPLIAIFIAISGSMGISYMAEGSLPGEPLYPVKVHINNNFKQAANEEDNILLLTNEITPSASVYLHASSASAITPSSGDEDNTLLPETNIENSTDLDAKQVINTR